MSSMALKAALPTSSHPPARRAWLVLVLLLAGSCATGPDPGGGPPKPAKAWAVVAEAIEKGPTGDERASFGRIRRRLLALSFADIDFFINRIGEGKALVCNHVADPGRGLSRERHQYLYLHWGRYLIRVDVVRTIFQEGGGVRETARVVEAAAFRPRSLIRAPLAKARLASPDWRIASEPFEGTHATALRRSASLVFLAERDFLSSLNEETWLPGEKGRALRAARLHAYRERIRRRRFTEAMMDRAAGVRRDYVRWMDGGGEPGWRRRLAKAFARTGDRSRSGTDRCLELMCLLAEVGHASTLPRTYSGEGRSKTYTATLSRELAAGLASILSSGGSRAGVCAVALLTGVDPFLRAHLTENGRPALLAALVEGLGCDSPVLRVLAARGIEAMGSLLLADYDPFAEGAVLARSRARVAKRLGRTGFSSCREEALRKRRETSVRRNLDVIASTRSLEARAGHITADLGMLVAAAKRRRFALALRAGEGGFTDDLGFLYQAATRAGRFRVLAGGRLWPGDGEVVFLYDERIGLTAVTPVPDRSKDGEGRGKQ